MKRWLDGIKPRGMTPHFIAEALSRKLGQPVSLREIGMGFAEAQPLPQPGEPERAEADCLAGITSLVAGDLSANPKITNSEIAADSWNSSMVGWLVNPQVATLPARSSGRVISAGTIEAVRVTTDMFSRLDYRFGGGHARSALLQHVRDQVEPLLCAASPETELGRQFFGEVAALMRLLAWMAYDTGRHGLAQRYMLKGLELAQAAGHRMLGGRILAGMSYQANYLGHYGMAVNLARAARLGANGAATPTAMALFHAMEARALASQRDEAGCSEALRQAERWFEQRDCADDPEWLHYFDQAELAAEFAHCFRDLQHPCRARDYVLESMAESETLYVRSLSFVRTILATSYVREGELEQGVATAREVVDTVADLASARTRRYVQEFLQDLTPQRGEPVVEEFYSYATGRLSVAQVASG